MTFCSSVQSLTKYIWNSPRRAQTRVHWEHARITATCPVFGDGVQQAWRMPPHNPQEVLTPHSSAPHVSSCRDSDRGLGQKLSGQWPWEDASLLTENTPLCPTITRNHREAVYSPKTSQRFQCEHCNFNFSSQHFFLS